MSTRSHTRWSVRHLLSYALVAAGITFLMLRFLAGVQAAAPRERQGACMALDAQQLDRPAPAWSLKDLQGKPVTLASLRGKVVLINFWATWCPPCVEEFPSMIKLFKAALGDDFAMVMVSEDDTPTIVSEFLSRSFPAAKDLPIVMDPGKKVALTYGSEKFPESYLVDRDGKLRYWFINKRNWGSKEAIACINSML